MRSFSAPERNRFWRRLAVLPACALLWAASGCTPHETNQKYVEITLWSMWTGQEEINFNRVLRRYEALHPGVKILNLGAVTDDTKTIRALVAGVPPDIFTLSDPSYLGPLAQNHAIQPLDAMFRQSGMKEQDFVPVSLGICRYHGELYGLPYLIDDLALTWNKTAFKEVGLDPDHPPRTLEELAEDAVKLTKRDEAGNITRLGLSLSDLYEVLAASGGRLVDPATGRITADDPANMAAIEWYKNLVERIGGIEKVRAFQSGFGSSQGASNPFFVGKVAMAFQGEWTPYWISRYAPGLEYGVAPVPPPQRHPELARTTWMGGNVFCIPVDSHHAKEAWDFLVWTQTEEAQIMFAHDMNNVPNQRVALKAPRLRNGPTFRREYSQFLDLADSPNASFFPVLPVTSLYMNQLNTAIDKILYGDMTPARALNEVQARVQKELDHS